VYFNQTEEYILSRRDTKNKMQSLGVNTIVEFKFSDIAKVEAEEYITMLVNKYHPVSISTGFNHTFGNGKKGNPKMLKKLSKKLNFKYECVDVVIENDEVVSSTLIKDYIINGNVEYANTLLESNFIVDGIVIKGEQIGRTIGFPTANINYPEKIVKLPYGVYYVTVNDKKALMNWGVKPTVNNTGEPVAEIHILDFDGNLYGHYLRAEVIKQIRPEQKFDNLNELKKQIKKDIKECLKL
jgi:riboflavin kinase/FMN adenylyltransferase